VDMVSGNSLVEVGSATNCLNTLLLGLSELGNVAIHGIDDDCDLGSHWKDVS
jgi:hypothetical protein